MPSLRALRFDPGWLTQRLASLDARRRIRLHGAMFGAALLWLALVWLAAYIDGTLRLPGAGRGFLEHGGYVVLHMAAPLACSLAVLALEAFAKLMRSLESYLRDGPDTAAILQLRDKQMAAVNLHSHNTWLLLLFMVVGALCSTLVLCQVVDPRRTYGNDVFNALQYPVGYYAANSFLALSWTLLFPWSLFTILQISASTVAIIGRARGCDALKVDLLHHDNCGGLSAFGNLNLLLMVYYLPPFLAMTALGATHAQRYASLLLPAAGLSLVFVTQSFVGVYAIYLAISDEKRKRIAGLHDHLVRALASPEQPAENSLSFHLWQHVRAVSSMPYSKNVLAAVNVVRFVPPLIAAYNVLLAGN